MKEASYIKKLERLAAVLPDLEIVSPGKELNYCEIGSAKMLSFRYKSIQARKMVNKLAFVGNHYALPYFQYKNDIIFTNDYVQLFLYRRDRLVITDYFKKLKDVNISEKMYSKIAKHIVQYIKDYKYNDNDIEYLALHESLQKLLNII